MPRPFPAEFRMRAVALVRAGKLMTTAAVELSQLVESEVSCSRSNSTITRALRRCATSAC